MIKKFTKFKKDEFSDLVKFLLNNTYFQFNNNFFQQLIGSPMGSKTSPVLSNIAMEDLEVEIISKIKTKLKVRLMKYYRFVDDIYTIVPTVHINEILNIFNSHDSYLKFTLEKKSNNTLNFLELSIIRDDKNMIIKNWYRNQLRQVVT